MRWERSYALCFKTNANRNEFSAVFSKETCISPDSLERFNVVEMVLCVSWPSKRATARHTESMKIPGICWSSWLLLWLPCATAKVLLGATSYLQQSTAVGGISSYLASFL